MIKKDSSKCPTPRMTFKGIIDAAPDTKPATTGSPVSRPMCNKWRCEKRLFGKSLVTNDRAPKIAAAGPRGAYTEGWVVPSSLSNLQPTAPASGCFRRKSIIASSACGSTTVSLFNKRT
jgi:hypothetical protein